jgi:hypothetical protein
LGVGFLVKDDSEACGEINDVSRWIVVNILPGILAPITINVFKLVGDIRRRTVLFGGALRLDSCGSLPWSYGEELFSLTDFISLELKEFTIIIRSLLVEVIDINVFTIDSSAASIISVQLFWGLSPIFCGIYSAITRCTRSHFLI